MTEPAPEPESNDEIYKRLLDGCTDSEYQKHAEAVLKYMGVSFHAEFDRHGYMFPDDERRGEMRDIFTCYLKRDHNDKVFSTRFGQSINDTTGDGGNPPNAYDLLACLEKYDPEEYEDWCFNFGFEFKSADDMRENRKTWERCVVQYKDLDAMFTERELELMQTVS